MALKLLTRDNEGDLVYRSQSDRLVAGEPLWEGGPMTLEEKVMR